MGPSDSSETLNITTRAMINYLLADPLAERRGESQSGRVREKEKKRCLGLFLRQSLTHRWCRAEVTVGLHSPRKAGGRARNPYYTSYTYPSTFRKAGVKPTPGWSGPVPGPEIRPMKPQDNGQRSTPNAQRDSHPTLASAWSSPQPTTGG